MGWPPAVWQPIVFEPIPQPLPWDTCAAPNLLPPHTEGNSHFPARNFGVDAIYSSTFLFPTYAELGHVFGFQHIIFSSVSSSLLVRASLLYKRVDKRRINSNWCIFLIARAIGVHQACVVFNFVMLSDMFERYGLNSSQKNEASDCKEDCEWIRKAIALRQSPDEVEDTYILTITGTELVVRHETKHKCQGVLTGTRGWPLRSKRDKATGYHPP